MSQTRLLVAAVGGLSLAAVTLPSLLAGHWDIAVPRTAALLLYAAVARDLRHRIAEDARHRAMWRLARASAIVNMASLVLLGVWLPGTHATTWAPAIPQVVGVCLLVAAATRHPLLPLPRREWLRVGLEAGTLTAALLIMLVSTGVGVDEAQTWALGLMATVPACLMVIGLNRVEEDLLGRATVLAVPLLVIATGGAAFYALKDAPDQLDAVAGAQLIAIPLLLLVGLRVRTGATLHARLGARLLPDIAFLAAVCVATARRIMVTEEHSDAASMLLVGGGLMLLVRHLGTTVRLARDNQALEEQVAERTADLDLAMRRSRAILDSAPVGIGHLDGDGRILAANPMLCHLLGVDPEDVPPTVLLDLVGPGPLQDCLLGLASSAEGALHRPHADPMVVRMDVTPDAMVPGGPDGRILVLEDLTEQQRLAMDLQQASRLEAVGRLASGVAHEINTPIQFIGDNLSFLDDAVGTLLRWLGEPDLDANADPDANPAATGGGIDQAELAYLSEEIPEAVRQSLGGIERVASIVAAMKVLGHMDGTKMEPADLNAAIADTVLVARGETKHVATVDLDLGDLPLVTCHVASLGQVVLNLLINAVHAIAEQGRADGTIVVTTRQVGEVVEVSVTDDGPGIPADVVDRVFDPFFTTKAVGAGTGQGLAMARATLREHHGAIEVDTREGVGTCFTLRLPITPARPEVPAEQAALAEVGAP